MGRRYTEYNYLPLAAFLLKFNLLVFIFGFLQYQNDPRPAITTISVNLPLLIGMADAENGASAQNGNGQVGGDIVGNQVVNPSQEDVEQVEVGRQVGAIRDEGQPQVPPSPIRANDALIWFKPCYIKKDKELKKLYVMSGGVARKFSTTKYANW